MEAFAASTVPFLHTLADARIPALTWFFEKLTLLGDEKIFVLVALVAFWCFSKEGGLYMLTTGFAASSIGHAMKLIFRIPRPWLLDETMNGKVVPSALESNLLGEGADGWSFPSGHTLIAVGTYGGMAYWFRQKWVVIAGVALAVLIPFSRLYLGVHTPVDILAGALITLALMVLLRPMFTAGEGRIRAALACGAVLSIVMLAVLYLIRPAELSAEDSELYASGVKNLWQLVGAALAVCGAYEVDCRWTHFETKASLPVQIVKIVVGSLLLLGLQTGVRKLLGYTKPVTLENMTRNGIAIGAANFVGLTGAMTLWPMAFRRLGQMFPSRRLTK